MALRVHKWPDTHGQTANTYAGHIWIPWTSFVKRSAFAMHSIQFRAIWYHSQHMLSHCWINVLQSNEMETVSHRLHSMECLNGAMKDIFASESLNGQHPFSQIIWYICAVDFSELEVPAFQQLSHINRAQKPAKRSTKRHSTKVLMLNRTPSFELYRNQ